MRRRRKQFCPASRADADDAYAPSGNASHCRAVSRSLNSRQAAFQESRNDNHGEILEYFASLVADEDGIPLTETVLSICPGRRLPGFPWTCRRSSELAMLDMLAVRA
ncbi:hypothetical protein ACU4GD_35845 [Cupriavidus basilensis]